MKEGMKGVRLWEWDWKIGDDEVDCGICRD